MADSGCFNYELMCENRMVNGRLSIHVCRICMALQCREFSRSFSSQNFSCPTLDYLSSCRNFASRSLLTHIPLSHYIIPATCLFTPSFMSFHRVHFHCVWTTKFKISYIFVFNLLLCMSLNLVCTSMYIG